MTTNPNDAIIRDRWGRPKIVPPTGGKPVAYTRTSTLAKALDDTTALTNWKLRQVAAGLAQRRDLIDLLATNPDRRKIDKIVQQALDAAQSDAAANRGTALHSFTEAADQGEPIERIPTEHRQRIADYQTALADAGLKVVACEKFVVNDDIQVAGTFDRLLLDTNSGNLIIGDIKTGNSDVKWIGLSTAIQVAVYARGQLYTPPIDGTPAQRHPLPVDTTTGVLIHMPQDGDHVTLHRLDLDVGWFAALQAVDVRNTRKQPPPAAAWRP